MEKIVVMFRTFSLCLLLVLIISSCSMEPRPVNYGEEACQYCKMTIVDEQHAAQVVTDKGKIFSFDAIECMVYYVDDHAETEFAHLVVCDFDNPGNWLKVEAASFLISPGLPSPMGADLNAFSSEARALEMQSSHEGQTFDWEGLFNHLN